MTGVGPNPDRKMDLQWMKSQDFIYSNTTQILQINNRTVSVKKSLPGAVFFSVWLHAASSTHIRSVRALVTTEMPGDPTDVVLGDTETRSAATASKPPEIISSSQREIRSMRRQDYEPQASDCTALCTRWKQLLPSELPLYMSSELVKCQVRVIQKPKQRSKMVNNTLLTLRVEFVPVPLSVHE